MSEHTVNVFEPQRFKICLGDSEKDTACLYQEGGRNKGCYSVGLASVRPLPLGPGRSDQPQEVSMALELAVKCNIYG